MSKFTTTLPKDVNSALATMKAELEAHGGQFNGDEHTGSFITPTGIGEVRGNYSIAGKQMTVEIVKKPMLLPLSTIEKALRNHLG